MRIIFINRYFHPDHSATSQFLTDLAFHFVAQKVAVTVIASTQYNEEPEANLPATDSVCGVNVIRVAGSRFDLDGQLKQALDYLAFCHGVYKTLSDLVQEGDVVIAGTDPPLLSVVCGWIARRRGAGVVNWLHDFFPEVTVGVGPRLPGFIVSALRRIRDRSLCQAGANVVLSEAMADRARTAGVRQERVHVIGHWGLAGVDAGKPVAATALRTKWKLGARFVVGYSGSLGPTHDRETLLSGIEKTVHTGDPDLAWLFVGSGEGMRLLHGSVPMRAVDGVHFQDHLPLGQLAQGLAVPDLHLVSMLPSLEGLVYPSKLVGILAAGKPVVFVGAKDGEIGSMLTKEGCGIAVQSGDKEGLAAAIAQLRAIPDSRADMGRRARALYERQFARVPALAAWTALLASVARDAQAQAEPLSRTD